MDDILTPKQLNEILDSGDFSHFLGRRETEIFEAKQMRPYELPERGALMELAKDVACMANQSGGCIVFGLSTGKNGLSPNDIVTSVGVFDKKDFYDIDGITSQINSSVYPSPEFKFIWHPLKENKSRGLYGLHIPEQREKRYFIVKVTELDGKKVKELFGIPVRNNDGIDWIKVSEIYGMTKARPNSMQEAHEDIVNRIDGLEQKMNRITFSMPAIDMDSIPAMPDKLEEAIYGK